MKLAFILTVVALIVFTFYKYSKKSQLTLGGFQETVVVFDTQKEFNFEGLVKHNGQEFTKEDIKGCWSVVYFGYTFCPDICPISLGQINKMDLELKKQNPALANTVKYIMISIDPYRDTIEKLEDYLSYFNSKFIGVTGDIKGIYNLAQQLDVAFTKVTNPEDEFYLVDHSANLIIINPSGNYCGYIPPPLDPKKLSLMLQSINNVF